MTTIQIFDPPLCCSTGICGPEVDSRLVQVAADVEWLKSLGHPVERFNLAQQPQAFINHPQVHELLGSVGTECLPLVFVDGRLVSRKDYPSRETWQGILNGLPGSSLPLAQSGGCCGPHGCC